MEDDERIFDEKQREKPENREVCRRRVCVFAVGFLGMRGG